MNRWAMSTIFAAIVLSGCASNAARQTMVATAASRPAAEPERDVPARTQAAQQSGQGNVTGQFDASGWTGLEYSTAVPVGQVVLMAMMLVLSHRREVLRIKQNGKSG